MFIFYVTSFAINNDGEINHHGDEVYLLLQSLQNTSNLIGTLNTLEVSKYLMEVTILQQ